MSEQKSSFSFGAPVSGSSAPSPFGQTTTSSGNQAGAGLFGSSSNAPATSSPNPFGGFGGTPSAQGNSLFGGGSGGGSSNQGASLFGGGGGAATPGGLGSGQGASGASAGFGFAQKSNAPSGANTSAASSAPAGSPFGAPTTGGAGFFPNMNANQPKPASTEASSTPETGPKSSNFFGQASTTPAGPPPQSATPQQPTSSLFGSTANATTSAQQAPTTSAPSNLFGNASQSTSGGFFPNAKPAEAKSSGQSGGVSFNTAGGGGGPALFGEKGNIPQPSANIFGHLSKPQESAASSQPSPSNSSSFASAPSQQQQQQQPSNPGAQPQAQQQSGASPGFSLFSNPTPAMTSEAPKTSIPSIMSNAGQGPAATQAPKPLFSFPTTSETSSAAPPTSTATAPAPNRTAASSLFPPSSTASSGAPGTSAPATSASGFRLNLTPASPVPATTAGTAATTAPASAGPGASAPSLFNRSSQPAGTAATTSAAPIMSAAPAGAPNSTAAGTGGPAAANNNAAITGPPPPQSRLKNKSLEEIITSWAKDLGEYQKEFQNQAVQVAKWDVMLVENGEKIQKLYASTFEAERASSEVERQLSSVESQQEELSGWLDRYEREVDDLFSRHAAQGGEGLQGQDQERERTYKLAERVSDRLEEMSKDLTSMVEAINTASSTLNKTSKDDDPLSQVVRVLNSHLASLQWIDQNASALEAKVAAALKSSQSLRGSIQDGPNREAVDDFYRSYMGRR